MAAYYRQRLRHKQKHERAKMIGCHGNQEAPVSIAEKKRKVSQVGVGKELKFYPRW